MSVKYEAEAYHEMMEWCHRMTKRPSAIGKATKLIQNRINGFIPEKAHEIVTLAVENMVKAVMSGSDIVTPYPIKSMSLENRERIVMEKASLYMKGAALSGAGIGAGGLILSLADFPVLIGIKMKFLFEVASIYGFDTRDYRERLYALNVLQLAFSSREKRSRVFRDVYSWESKVESLPEKYDEFDWREFQQEYRDYMDVAKLMQLLPVIGAGVGAYTNYKLLGELCETAMNAYRLRLFKSGAIGYRKE